MSEKNKNDILEEQRKARQEFLELKKMQKGEMEAPPKPSEVAIVPKTPKEKWDNFWFQYKWHTIIIVALAAVLSVLIAQCATRTVYDYEVVYFSYTATLDEQVKLIADYLTLDAEDLNGDGEVNVQVVNCSFSKTSGDVQYRNTMMTKLQAIIAGDEKAIIYITDKEGYEYLRQISKDGDFLEGEPLEFSDKFYAATTHEQFGGLPEGLSITSRRVSDTVIEKKKDAKQAYEASKELLNKIKEKN